MTDAPERDLPLILRNGEITYRLSVLGRLLPEKPERSTVWQWITEGRVNRETGCIIKMEAIQRTDGLCSSVEAYHRFIRRLNGFDE